MNRAGIGLEVNLNANGLRISLSALRFARLTDFHETPTDS